MLRAMRVYISGVVQGVGFRFFVERHAQGLGLKGYVRNLPDGRVEVYAEGKEENLRKLIPYLRQGPSLARVDDIEIEWLPFSGRYKSFHIAPTW